MVFFRRKNVPIQFNQARLSKAYIKQQRLGEGSFAVVYKVLDEQGGTFAMKEEFIHDSGDFANESRLLTLLRHPNIVTLHEFGMEGNKQVLVLEYVGGGALSRVLSQMRQPLLEITIREYTRQILTALEYCHSFGVVHRDLKASNILMTETGRLKLADFGGSKHGPATLSEEALKASAPMQMTLLWAAPEQLRNLYTCKSDIWSLGCTMIEMATLKRPWPDKEFTCAAALTYFLLNQQSGPPIPSHLSEDAKNFMKLCFTMDYTQRPSASELLQHKWFHPEGTLSLGSLSGSTGSCTNSTNSTNSSAVGPDSVELPEGPSSPGPSPMTDTEFRRIIGETDGPMKISWVTTLETTRVKRMEESTLYTPPKRITEEEMAANILEAESRR